MKGVSELIGEPVQWVEARRLEAKKDAPWYRFAVGQSGAIYSLEGLEDDPSGPEKGQPRFMAVTALPVAEADENAQKAAVCLGHVLPEIEEPVEQEP